MQGIGNRESGIVQARIVGSRQADRGSRVSVSCDAGIQKHCIVNGGFDDSPISIPHSPHP